MNVRQLHSLSGRGCFITYRWSTWVWVKRGWYEKLGRFQGSNDGVDRSDDDTLVTGTGEGKNGEGAWHENKGLA